MDIFIDWGSSNFRAFLVDGHTVIDRLDRPDQGIFKSFATATAASHNTHYSDFLAHELSGWLKANPKTPILMCGMVGSREGWVEVPYVEAPAGFAEIASRIYPLTDEQRGVLADRPISIVPGLTISYENGRDDVIRSEETKALGAATSFGMASALLCIPGTHCKWIRIQEEKITEIHTIPTGGLYDLLSKAGWLASLCNDTPSTSAVEKHYPSFDAGLSLSKAGFEMSADIFQVRTQQLRSSTPPQYPASHLSGILIGHEFRQMQKLYPDIHDVVLVSDLGPRQLFYERAAEKYGFSVAEKITSEAAVCSGLIHIAQQEPQTPGRILKSTLDQPVIS